MPASTSTPLPALPPPPMLDTRHALFLDVDGCLLELAPTPDAVQVPPWLAGLLDELSRALDGAVAVISGRSLDALARLLAPWPLVAAGVHGAEMQLPGQPPMRASGEAAAQLAQRLAALPRRWPQVLVEYKGTAVAVHFARCPERSEDCRLALQAALVDLPELVLRGGHGVWEAVPAGASKGDALRRLMASAPFAGRVPVFAGDDQTDETAFAVLAHEPEAVAVKIGPGDTLARFRLGTPNQVLTWLQASLAAGLARRPESIAESIVEEYP